MRDGLPMNDPSLMNVPFSPTLQNYRDPFLNNAFPQVSVAYIPALPRDKAMRPWMSAGSSYIAFFGDTPDSSSRVRDNIPRVKYDSWPNRSTNARATYNGDDFHLYDPDFG